MSSKIPKQYLPKTLTPADRKKQKESIEKKTIRPKLESAKTKRSRLVVAFEQWARARLAGVITGIGGARKIDKKIWDKYKI